MKLGIVEAVKRTTELEVGEHWKTFLKEECRNAFIGEIHWKPNELDDYKMQNCEKFVNKRMYQI